VDKGDFQKQIIDPLVKGAPDNPSFLGFPQIKPADCFTKEKNVKVRVLCFPTKLLCTDRFAKVTIFTPSNRAASSMKWSKGVELLIPAVAKALGLPESEIVTQLYDAPLSATWKDKDETVMNLDTASGKVFLTYNPDIFKDKSMAAYQVWAGAQLKEVDGIVTLQANSAINTPMMSVSLFSISYRTNQDQLSLNGFSPVCSLYAIC
jgi:hypothetical protein